MKRTSDQNPKRKTESFLKDVGAKCNKIDFNSFFIYGAIVLAVGAGFYSLLSPSVRSARLANPNDPKVLVASDGPSLRSNVAPTLSSARYFLMINPVTSKIVEAAKNPFLVNQVVHGADVAYFVAGKGEEAVIAGDIGPQCYQVLAQYGIRAYGGYSGKVKDVVALYQDGRNSAAPVAIPAQGFGHGVNMTTPVGFTTPFFICPRCKWRVHVGMTMAQKIRCPNCGFLGTPADGFTKVALNPLAQDPTIPQAPAMDVAFPAQAQQIPSYAPQGGYAPGYGNNQQCLIAPGGAQSNTGYVQQVAWGNGYGAGAGAGAGAGTGRRRTTTSPYTWR